MMTLISTNTPLIRKAMREYPHLIGRFVTPRVFYASSFPDNALWAADNDCFNDENFNPGKFIKMLKDLSPIRSRCLFATCPDVVGDAIATLARFQHWRKSIAGLGYPVAFVGQDGLENLDVPWEDFDVFFIGGTTEWKLSQSAVKLAREAKRRGKWMHVGRINSKVRYTFCHKIGADSVDGNTFGFGPDIAIRKFLPLLRSLDAQMELEL